MSGKVRATLEENERRAFRGMTPETLAFMKPADAAIWARKWTRYADERYKLGLKRGAVTAMVFVILLNVLLWLVYVAGKYAIGWLAFYVLVAMLAIP
jgi:hypothetical protein